MEDKLKTPLFVAFYTKGTGYQREVKRLKKSCKKFNLDLKIKEYSNLGSWKKNTLIMPSFIKRMMDKYRDRSIVYLDADAEVVSMPKLFFELDCPIAVHQAVWSDYVEGNNSIVTCSGTMFLNNGDESRDIVERWGVECDAHPEVTDEVSLVKIMGNNFYNLPARYCKIFDYMEKVKDPVILHHQASRRFKKKINRQGI